MRNALKDPMGLKLRRLGFLEFPFSSAAIPTLTLCVIRQGIILFRNTLCYLAETLEKPLGSREANISGSTRSLSLAQWHRDCVSMRLHLGGSVVAYYVIHMENIGYRERLSKAAESSP
jgi:hypothetical protein